MEVVNALVQSERGFITEYDLENTIQNYTSDPLFYILQI